jgi:hypothetical protein
MNWLLAALKFVTALIGWLRERSLVALGRREAQADALEAQDRERADARNIEDRYRRTSDDERERVRDDEKLYRD